MDLSTTDPASWPTTAVRNFFLYDTEHPITLVASVISAGDDTRTYLVTCDAPCSSDDFPAQTITHASGSSWAGERVAGGSRTSWACDLGVGGPVTASFAPDHAGYCQDKTVDADEKHVDLGTISSSAINTCFLESRSVPVSITAGVTKLYDGGDGPLPSQDPKDLISARSENLTSLSCKTTSSEPEPTGTRTENDLDIWGWSTKSNHRAEIFGSSTGSATDDATPTPVETGDSGAGRLSLSLVLLGASMVFGSVLSL